MTHPVLKADSSLSDWLSYLETLHPTANDLGLCRIREVAQRLNIKLDSVVITVGGTNGKGSTQAMIRAGLEGAGFGRFDEVRFAIGVVVDAVEAEAEEFEEAGLVAVEVGDLAGDAPSRDALVSTTTGSAPASRLIAVPR